MPGAATEARGGPKLRPPKKAQGDFRGKGKAPPYSLPRN